MAKTDKTRRKIPGVYSPLIPVFIIVATLITITLVTNISSNTTFKKKDKKKSDGVITSVVVMGDEKVNDVSNIKNNLLQGHIELDKDENSIVVVSVNIKNIYDYPIVYEGLTTDTEDPTLYSNKDIVAMSQLMNVGTIIPPGNEDTVDLVFKYQDGVIPDNNKLDFYLNLVFKKYDQIE